MKVAYLASNATLANSVNRRPDAFEHDQMMDCLRSAFEAHGAIITDVAWDDKKVDWKEFDAAIIGTAWDYQDRLEEFLATLETIAGVAQLFNSPAMVRWNSHKIYLRELGDKGIALIPTHWLDQAGSDNVGASFDLLDANEIVLKRQIGASAEGQHRLHRGDAIPQMPEPMMVQPFMRSIITEGEYSFIFIDGALSHALIKKPADNDYRIQATYGGSEAPIAAAPEDVTVAADVLSALDDKPLYARVDMLRGEDGALLLMELELVEPFLYPLQGPELGQRIYHALTSRL